ncbi:MAG: CapA family protein [Oscillospiraceae bacterium]|nr:CapA family protein [Oscillospiraceae bacterium]
MNKIYRYTSVYLAVIAVALAGVAVWMFLNMGDTSEAVNADPPTYGQTVPVTTPPEKNDPRVSIVSFGENLLTKDILAQAKERSSQDSYDFSYLYENLHAAVSGADLATVNQAGPIAKSQGVSAAPLCNSPEELGSQLKALGFGLVNLAGDHMLDKKEPGFTETVNYWKNNPDIRYTGAYLNLEELLKPEISEINGITFGFVGVTGSTNNLNLPADTELRYILSSDEELLKQKIELTAAECDIVIVNISWGNVADTAPAEAQKVLAKKMSDWGADVIIGFRPITLLPVEMIEKADGSSTLVAYSLGCVISQQPSGERVVSGMLKYNVVKNPDTGRTAIQDIQLEPIVTHYATGQKNIKAYLYSQYSDELAGMHGVKANSKNFGMEYINKNVRSVIDAKYLNMPELETETPPTAAPTSAATTVIAQTAPVTTTAAATTTEASAEATTAETATGATTIAEEAAPAPTSAVETGSD